MKRPRLSKTWKRDLRAHSVKWIGVGAIFAGLEAVAPLFVGQTLINPYIFAFIMFFIFAGAFVTRFTAQKGFDDGE